MDGCLCGPGAAGRASCGSRRPQGRGPARRGGGRPCGGRLCEHSGCRGHADACVRRRRRRPAVPLRRHPPRQAGQRHGDVPGGARLHGRHGRQQRVPRRRRARLAGHGGRGDHARGRRPFVRAHDGRGDQAAARGDGGGGHDGHAPQRGGRRPARFWKQLRLVQKRHAAPRARGRRDEDRRLLQHRAQGLIHLAGQRPRDGRHARRGAGDDAGRLGGRRLWRREPPDGHHARRARRGVGQCGRQPHAAHAARRSGGRQPPSDGRRPARRRGDDRRRGEPDPDRLVEELRLQPYGDGRPGLAHGRVDGNGGGGQRPPCAPLAGGSDRRQGGCRPGRTRLPLACAKTDEPLAAQARRGHAAPLPPAQHRRRARRRGGHAPACRGDLPGRGRRRDGFAGGARGADGRHGALPAARPRLARRLPRYRRRLVRRLAPHGLHGRRGG